MPSLTLYQVCAQDTAPRNELDSPVGLVDVVLWGGQEGRAGGPAVCPQGAAECEIFGLKGELRSLVDPTFRLAKWEGHRSTQATFVFELSYQNRSRSGVLRGLPLRMLLFFLACS